MPTGPIGDIKNYVRKKSLDGDIRDTIRDNVTGDISVGDIYVIGSWGRGDAVPGASDIDVVFIVEECYPSNEMADKFKSSSNPCSEQLFEKSMVGSVELNGLHPKIDGIDFVPTDSYGEFKREMIAFLSSDEPNRGYNLTEQETVWLGDFIESPEDTKFIEKNGGA